MEISEKREEEHIACEMVEDEKVVEEVRRQKPGQYRLLREREITASTPDYAQEGGVEKKISKKAEQPSHHCPVEEDVVRAVKPRLELIHLRLVMLLEDIGEILLPPTQNRTFLEALIRYRPDEIAALSPDFCESKIRKARKHRALGHKRRVFNQEKSTDKNGETDYDRDACLPYRTVLLVHRIDNSHHQETAEEAKDGASGRRVIDNNNLENDKQTVHPAHILISPLSRHKKQSYENVDEHVNREINGVAESAVHARHVLRRLENAPNLENGVASHDGRGDKRRVPPPLPMSFFKNRADDEKERAEVKERDVAFHALEVRPETY